MSYSETINETGLWEDALGQIELSISPANFNTWFKDTCINKIEEGTAYLTVPNSFVRDWLANKYHSEILKTLRNLSDGSIRSVEYVVGKFKKQEKESPKTKVIQQPEESLPLDNYYINKEDNLNPRYDFESFIVGPFNELAHAASQAIIKQPGIVYNPLFIYGNTGHGKTHLIQAIGNHIKKSDPNKKVFYVTSEKFTIDYIKSVESNKTNYFKEKYRKYDVLIMDDIQFLSKKEKTQEELFHLFNTLYDNNKQIIFSSDKHPNYIQNLEERLKSRFGAGMIVDIPAPDPESRIAILREKVKQHNLDVEMEIIEYLANSINGNVRELEGAINSVVMHYKLKGEITMDNVRKVLKDNSQPKKNIPPIEVIKKIAEFYNIEESLIYQKTRKKEVIKPRQITMYILREDFGISYPSIGEKLGGRDHTTVIHSCEKIKNDLKNNEMLEQEVQQIRSIL